MRERKAPFEDIKILTWEILLVKRFIYWTTVINIKPSY